MDTYNRKVLKEQAKKALKANFWMIMLVELVGTLLGCNWNGLQSGGFNPASMINYTFQLKNPEVNREFFRGISDAVEDNTGKDFDFQYDDAVSFGDNMEEFWDEFQGVIPVTEEDVVRFFCYLIGIVLIIYLVISALILIVQFLIGSFLCAPVGVGYRRYFMRNREEKAEFKDLFAVFSAGNYMKVVGTMFATNIRIWGWKLLFYFPGLVKYYQYYFVPFIMAENPNITKERARELSREMTDGYKWHIFVLELSFLGWMLVFAIEYAIIVVCSCGVLAFPGIVLIYPLAGYITATSAELYASRRTYMLQSGISTSEELVGF